MTRQLNLGIKPRTGKPEYCRISKALRSSNVYSWDKEHELHVEKKELPTPGAYARPAPLHQQLCLLECRGAGEPEKTFKIPPTRSPTRCAYLSVSRGNDGRAHTLSTTDGGTLRREHRPRRKRRGETEGEREKESERERGGKLSSQEPQPNLCGTRLTKMQQLVWTAL